MTLSHPPGDDDVSKPIARPFWLRSWFVGGALLWLVVVAAGGAYFWLRVEARPRPAASTARVGGPFDLVGPDGRSVTDRDFRGKFMLIYFGYTHCPDVCPATLAKIAAALQALGASATDVQPLFITVDPAHDTPAVMGRYTGQISRRILGLTGSTAHIAAVEKAYGVYASFQRTGPDALNYMMDHSSIVYLMGPDGQFVAPIRTDGRPADMAADISQYVER